MTAHAPPSSPPPSGPHRGIIAWFAGNHVAANILMVFLILGGILSARSMVSEIFPTIDAKTITISTIYPGATPYDVEDSITRRIEETLIGIEGVKRVSSSASEGYGTVTVELEDFADDRQVMDDVETEIDLLADFPPEDAEEPSIVRSRSTANVMTLAVHGVVEEKTLHYWAERIKDDLVRLPGISLVTINGGRDFEIAIEVSEATLRDYGLTLQDVAERVSYFSTDVPGGTLRTEANEILLRVQDKRYIGEDFGDITIRSRTDGTLLRLADIATIRDGFEDVELINEFNGEAALLVNIERSATQDTLTADRTIRSYLDDIAMPKGVSVSIWQNNTDILRDRISLLLRNAILGYVLVFLCLLFFLDLRLAFWVGMGIPISFLGGLLALSFTGVTINMITLFAFIVVLGIVVDDAIVAGESIFHEQEKDPNNPFAVLEGVRRVMAPVMVGVLTTVAAFAPLLFSTGILGQIMMPVPMVVIAVLLLSLVEAFLILPAHLHSPSYWSRGLLAGGRDRTKIWLENVIATRVVPGIDLALRWRYVTLAIGVAMLIITSGIFSGGHVRFIFFPQIDSDEITVDLEMPNGTPFSVTHKHAEHLLRSAKEMERRAKEQMEIDVPIIEATSFTVGSKTEEGGPPGHKGNNTISSHIAQIKLEIIPGDDRDMTARELEDIWREISGDIPGAKQVAFESSLVRAGADVNVELSHRDEAVLEEAADTLVQKLREIEGVTEITDSFDSGKQEFVFELTKAGLAAGLTPRDIGHQIRSAYYGIEIQRIQRDRNELKVMVRYPEGERRTLADLYNTRLRLANGSQMDLRDAATIRQQRGYSVIKRVDGRRVVTITADVDKTLNTPDDVNLLIETDLMPDILMRYNALSYSFEGATRDQQEDRKNLMNNMLIAMMIMFVMLASQLRSYLQPLIILTAIPFGFVGAILGHLIMGYDLSFISIFGMVALSGVVINDSVVLVDYYNHLREKTDLDMHDALINAVARRFRPVILTTLTTSLGLLPMLLETSIQARFLIPMAVSIAFGILYASTVILFLLPALLMIVEDIRLWLRHMLRQQA